MLPLTLAVTGQMTADHVAPEFIPCSNRWKQQECSEHSVPFLPLSHHAPISTLIPAFVVVAETPISAQMRLGRSMDLAVLALQAASVTVPKLEPFSCGLVGNE